MPRPEWHDVKRRGLMDEQAFEPLAWTLHRAGVRPLHVTLLQLPVYAVQLWCGTHGAMAGLLAAAVAGIALDVADGMLARLTHQTSALGAVADTVADVLGIAVILLIAGIVYPYVTPWCVLLAVLNAAIVAVRGARRGVPFTRGPLTLGVVFEPTFHGALWAGLAVPLGAAAVVLVVMARGAARARRHE